MKFNDLNAFPEAHINVANKWMLFKTLHIRSFHRLSFVSVTRIINSNSFTLAHFTVKSADNELLSLLMLPEPTEVHTYVQETCNALRLLK